MRRLCEEKALFGELQPQTDSSSCGWADSLLQLTSMLPLATRPYSAVLAAGDDVSDETMPPSQEQHDLANVVCSCRH